MDLQDIKKATEKSGLTVDQLHWLIKKGRLPAYQPGGPRGKWYVRESDLEGAYATGAAGAKNNERACTARPEDRYHYYTTSRWCKAQ